MRAIRLGVLVALALAQPQLAATVALQAPNSPPKILTRVLPRYFASRSLDPVFTPEGALEVELTVDAQGAVETATISKPFAGHSEFNTDTLRALKLWKFEPARKDGAAASSQVLITVTFEHVRLPSRGGLGAPSVRTRLTMQGADDDFGKGAFGMRDPGVTPPRKTGDVPLKYPEAQKKRKAEGVVELEAVILPDGRVGDVRVVVPAEPDFDAEAIRVAKLWKYTAGKKDGQPVAVIIPITMIFTMR